MRLYPSIIRRATGARKRVRRFISPAEIINNTELIITKMAAELALIFPDGISRLSVLGLRESNFLSARRLKPIAAFLAKIMQRIIRIRSLMLNAFPVPDTARANPVIANGIAKTVWANFTSDR